MQKLMKLCKCPPDVCRADKPPEQCRFVMDPHDKQRWVNKPIKHCPICGAMNCTRPNCGGD